MRHVIIGTGPAGHVAARTIRALDDRAQIVLVGDEPHLPYNRHLLTDLLCGAITEEDLFRMAGPSLEDLRITLRAGVRASRIDPGRRCVHLSDGGLEPYDRLLIATGRRSVPGELLTSCTNELLNYYTYADALALKARLPHIEHVVIHGRTVSALNLLLGFCRLGKRVTYITNGPRVSIPIIDTEGATDLEALMREYGVEVLRQDRIASVVRAIGHQRVETYQGRELDCDVVYASESYRPCIACTRDTGIEANKGILVDLAMHTSLEDVYAAGDCVEIYHPMLRTYWVNFGWPNAEQQGRIAGVNMAGGEEQYQVADTIAFEILGAPYRARWWN